MIQLTLKILLEEEGENFCAKCCKTRNLIERMYEDVPLIKNNVKVIYENFISDEIISKYGNIIPPTIIINDEIYSQGHVPIIKKLSSILIKKIEV